jgi:hypothetical protein
MWTGGWNEAEREALQATIAARQPFLDFVFNRVMELVAGK